MNKNDNHHLHIADWRYTTLYIGHSTSFWAKRSGKEEVENKLSKFLLKYHLWLTPVDLLDLYLIEVF